MNLSVRSSNKRHKKPSIAAAIVCGVLLALPGCGIPKLRGHDAARELPETINGELSAENSSQVSIEEFFGDPTLINLMDQALVGNMELKILGEEIQIANNEVLRRRGAYLPFVTLGAGASLDHFAPFTLLGADVRENTLPNGSNFPQPLPDFLVSTNLSWQVDIWRQLRNARDAQTLRYLASIDGRNYVVTKMVAEIAEQYYTLMALDKTLENLDRTIALMEQSLEFSKRRKEGARGNELAVQRFLAEVRKSQSEKLIIKQQIIESENRINFLVGRFPQPVERSTEFFDLQLHALKLGLPCDLLLNRPDIREAERELAAAGLDIAVAKANFYPKLNLYAGVGFESFNAKYLFMTPETLIYNVAGDLMVPLINKRAIQAEYMNANATQLQAVYNYQRTVLNAFTEVVNRINKVKNYTSALEVKKQQLDALEASVVAATSLFTGARVEYMDVLFAQRDLRDARTTYIDTKKEQLTAIADTYQALGGGLIHFQFPLMENVGPGLNLPAPAAAPEGPTPVLPSPDEQKPADEVQKADEPKPVEDAKE